VVKTAVKWHWSRAKIQWKFLENRERQEIKWNIFWAVAWTGFLVGDVFFPRENYLIPRGIWVIFEVVLVYLAVSSAWQTFTDHLSPKIQTHEELTEGTE
jgi:hypothetical protein